MATRFQIPQFIEHEAKVVGPFTLKQSIYLGSPLVISFFLYFLLPTLFFIVILVLLEILGIALNVVKIGGKSLPTVIMHALGFAIAPKTYIWTKGKQKLNLGGTIEYGGMEGEEGQPQPPDTGVPMVQGSKLRSLSTQVETKR